METPVLQRVPLVPEKKRIACAASLACPHPAAWIILHPRIPGVDTPACNRCIATLKMGGMPERNVHTLLPSP